MKLPPKSYIIFLLFFIAPLSLAYSFPPFWDGVLLANKTDNEISAFIDKTENINDLIIIANIDGKKIKHEVKKYGRLMKITLAQGQKPKGFIMVKKLGFVVASVRLSETLPTKPYYLKARMDIMKSIDKKNGHLFLSRSYATLNKKSKTQHYSTSSNDILATENLNQGFSLKEERDPNEKIVKRDTSNYVYKESTIIIEEEKEPISKKELKARGRKKKKNRTSNHLLFEKYIHTSRFPLYEEQLKERKVSIAVKKDAKKFDSHYIVVNDFHSWLHLKKRNSKEHYAFDGESIFKIDEKYFNIRYTDEDQVEQFLNEFHLFIKPYNKKLLGIFYQKHEISALKSETDYIIKVLNNNTLVINTGSESYTLLSEDDFLIIKNKEKQIHKINKSIFHQEEHFYYKD